MTTTGEVPTLWLWLTYKNLRLLFAAGLALQIGLIFMPAYKTRFTDYGGAFWVSEERSFSDLDTIRMQFQNGHAGMGFFNVVVFSAFGALLVLAFKKPYRWVFLSGASLVSFLLVMEFFIGNIQGVVYLFVPRVLHFVSLSLPLTGFWIRPQVQPSL